jgi:hypothetical protein
MCLKVDIIINLHHLGAVDVQKTAQGLKEQVVLIPEPALGDQSVNLLAELERHGHLNCIVHTNLLPEEGN